jgi:hypothetical protein
MAGELLPSGGREHLVSWFVCSWWTAGSGLVY